MLIPLLSSVQLIIAVNVPVEFANRSSGVTTTLQLGAALTTAVTAKKNKTANAAVNTTFPNPLYTPFIFNSTGTHKQNRVYKAFGAVSFWGRSCVHIICAYSADYRGRERILRLYCAKAGGVAAVGYEINFAPTRHRFPLLPAAAPLPRTSVARGAPLRRNILFTLSFPTNKKINHRTQINAD
jgi:hypothetical protein